MVEVYFVKVMTITLNPALDLEYIIENFHTNSFFRIDEPVALPGGKGINVSLFLAGLGMESIAIGFLGGFVGNLLEESLRKVSDNIYTNFVRVESETRQDITIVDPVNDSITEINSKGPDITENELNMFHKRLSTVLNYVDIVVASGSLPNIPEKHKAYLEIAKKVCEAGKIFISECSSEYIEDLVETGCITVARPDLRGKEKLFGKKLISYKDYIDSAKYIVDKGTELAILSYHIRGDIIATKEGVWLFSTKKKIEKSHLLGAGDSYIAGVVYYLMNHDKNYFEAAKFGMSSAMAQSESLGKELFTLEQIEEYKNSFVVERLE